MNLFFKHMLYRKFDVLENFFRGIFNILYSYTLGFLDLYMV